MRPLSACMACRRRRKKCIRTKPGISCDFCIKRGLDCFFEPRSDNVAATNDYEPLVAHSATVGLSAVSSLLIPDPELLMELVDLYFRYVHVAFHNIFHRPTFEASVRNGSVPKILVFGVISLVARFSDHEAFANIDPLVRGEPYTKETERLLDLHKTSLVTIQACLLIAAAHVIEMQSTTESIMYSIACRMSMIMDLPNMTANNLLEREMNLRVWWSVVAVDTWSSSALGLPRAIEARYDIAMPMDERVFRQIDADTSPEIDSSVRSPSRSLIAQMILLNQILFKVNLFNKDAVLDPLGDDVVNKRVKQLSKELDDWYSMLPNDMLYSPENLSYWIGESCGSTFAILHMNYNHSSQLLLYRYLHLSSQEEDILSAAYAKTCKMHANQLCELVYQKRKQPDSNARHPLAGHMLVVASTVQLHTLLFSSDDDEVQMAKERLQANFKIINALQIFWPSLKASLSRFDTFHQACLQGKHSFRFDRYMLRFLLDFSQPVKERDGCAEDDLEAFPRPWS